MNPRLQLVCEVEAATGGRVVVIGGGLALMMGRTEVAAVERTADHAGDIRRLGVRWCTHVVAMHLARRTGEQ